MSDWHALPEQFTERLQALIPASELESVLASFCAVRHTTLRANTVKISPADLAEQLEASGIALRSVPWSEAAFIVTDIELRQVHHPLYTEGAFYVQSLSSMVPPLVLNPQPGEKVLDLTAAPGSKTTQMAAMMKNTGEIIANDLSPVRLFKLQANLKTQGVTNTFVRKGPGQYLWEKYPEYFDKTLIDVPCSMEGRFQCDDPESYEDWSLKKVKELSHRQKHLLRSAVTATKPGGVIVYSTCTLSPEENEEVVNWLLEKEAGNVVVEDIQLPGLTLLPGVTHWNGEEYHSDMVKTGRIMPSETMEGFFVAKLRKLGSSVPTSQPNHRQFKKRRFSKRRR